MCAGGRGEELRAGCREKDSSLLRDTCGGDIGSRYAMVLMAVPVDPSSCALEPMVHDWSLAISSSNME